MSAFPDALNKVDMIKMIRELLTNDTGVSTKSFSMFVSAVTAMVVGLCIGIVLIVDVSDGRIDTDLDGLAWLLLADGSLFGLGGVTKYLSEKKYNKKID